MVRQPIFRLTADVLKRMKYTLMTYILFSMVSSRLKELEAYPLLLETLEILFLEFSWKNVEDQPKLEETLDGFRYDQDVPILSPL